MKFPAFRGKSECLPACSDEDRGTPEATPCRYDSFSNSSDSDGIASVDTPLKLESDTAAIVESSDSAGRERDTWTSPREFLLSCIAMSVGLGNVWRFPQTVAKNGGGAFLVPYLIVLIFIGRPLYFMEAALGQFSSYGPVKLWHAVPILKGVGYGQAIATWMVTTYYCFQMAITVFYLSASLQSVLPWTVCKPEWINDCFNSSANVVYDVATDSVNSVRSSSSLFFTEEVTHKLEAIDDGIGLPDWRLVLCLLFAWLCVCLVLIRGVASSGKVAYFTAIFPYVVLVTLLVRGVTLPGAFDGIKYFFVPEWNKLLEANTWYAAVTQCFFSLAVGFGPVATFSSYNVFRHNIHRDVTIISLMDTFTSLLAGTTVFAVLGHLAHETGRHVSALADDSGQGLAFISYPEAIAKFTLLPHLFAVLFFLMMFTLGLGSTVSDSSCIITIICDALPRVKRWLVTIVVCTVGFLTGLVYTTPGGLFVLDIVDYFGAGFPIFIIVVVEVVGVCGIYGLKRFIADIEFMLDTKLGFHWKLSWAFFIPTTLATIFIYSAATYTVHDVGPGPYPDAAIGVGWSLSALVLFQIPLWAVTVLYRQKKGHTWFQCLEKSFQPSDEWGPKNEIDRHEWHQSQSSIKKMSPIPV